MTNDLDVAIVGGGPAGTAAALTLLKKPELRACVFERSTLDAPKVGESLSPGTRPLLEYLKVWPRFAAEQTLQFWGNEAAWGSDTIGGLDFILTLHGAGWLLDRTRFDAMLADEVTKRGGRIELGTSIDSARFDGDCWHLTTGGGKEVTARYLVDAGGRTSRLALSHGGVRHRHDNLTAIGARLPHAVAQGHQVTRVETFAGGWWYAAPLPSGTMMVCLFSDAEVIHAAHWSTPSAWLAALSQTKHIRPLLADTLDEPALEVWPAFSSLLRGVDPALPLTACGDAITGRDPLSSSGIPTALSTGIQAARTAIDALCGTGAMKAAYVDAIARDHRHYLETHWKTYKSEHRWPEAPFWRFRATQVTRTPATPIIAKPAVTSSIFAPKPLIEQAITLAAQPIRQVEVALALSAAFPEVPDERLLLAIEDVTQPVP